MARIDEIVSEQFAAWETRGRGWKLWPEPVELEPPFVEFTGYDLSRKAPEDDTRKPTFFASIFDLIQQRLSTAPEPANEPEPPPEPEPFSRAGEIVELRAFLPKKFECGLDSLRALLDQCATLREPVAFEIVATDEEISFQFVAGAPDASRLARFLASYLPEATFSAAPHPLADAWNGSDGEPFIFQCGLGREFLLPLDHSPAIDPFVSLLNAVSDLQAGEIAVVQTLFSPAQNPWAGSAWRAIKDDAGKALFVNRLHFLTGAKEKFSSALFATSLRVATKAESFDRAAMIAREVALSLRPYGRGDGNELIPLDGEDYSMSEQEEDLLARQSRRSGMILNADELIGFVHFPSSEVRISKLHRDRTNTRAAPEIARGSNGVLIGENEHAGTTVPVRLSPGQRVRHCHVIGASGGGKSTLLLHMIAQDIEAGEGVGVLDPHGDLIDEIMARIPEHRIDDVVLLDPSDEEFPVGFNVLSAHSSLEKTLLSSDLVSIFRRFSTSWGDQLNSVFANAISAFLENDRGGTLSDLRRFLLDIRFREEFLQTVRDPEIVFYWRKAFPQLGGNKSIGPVLTRLEMFLSPKPIRYMVSQKENRLDFGDILNSRQIFLAKLSQGQVGKENAFLLGSLLVSKFQQLAMARQNIDAVSRHDFWLYLDEFQNFICPSMSEVLSGARKYRVGLVLAHQELHQLQRDADVSSAVLGNAGTRIVFRVGDADAQALAKGFASFEPRDLQNLEVGQAVCRVERADFDFNLRVPLPEPVDPSVAAARRAQVTTRSREKYASSRDDVEAALARAVPEDSRDEKKRVSPVEPVAPVPKDVPVVAPAPVAPAVPTSTAPEKPVEVAAAAKPALPPSEGIGGALHQAMQKRIKDAAEALGFLAVIEKQIPHGSIDLWLQRNGFSVACEISRTTTIDHEFQNVQKCLQTDCAHVAVVTSRPARLEQIKEAVNAALAPDISRRVGYYTPDAFVAWLQATAAAQPVPAPAEPTTTVRRGRTVKKKVAKLSPEEQKQKQAQHMALIAEAMRSKPKQ